jgi:hypothetical protein
MAVTSLDDGNQTVNAQAELSPDQRCTSSFSIMRVRWQVAGTSLGQWPPVPLFQRGVPAGEKTTRFPSFCRSRKAPGCPDVMAFHSAVCVGL